MKKIRIFRFNFHTVRPYRYFYIDLLRRRYGAIWTIGAFRRTFFSFRVEA